MTVKSTNLAQRRKKLDKALAQQIAEWLDGKPGDICMGEIYDRFFR